MRDPFDSSKRRLRRARTHIRHLDQLSNEFLAKRPWKFVFEPRTFHDRPMKVLILRLTRRIEDEFGDVAIEAMDALRSALDQACYGSAVSLGKVEPKSAYFPFADDAQQLENTIKGRCKDLHPELIEMLRAFKPYAEGDRLLWAFNKNRHSNQHKVLIGLGASGSMVHCDFEVEGGGPILSPPQWDQEKAEAVLAYFPVNAVLKRGNIKTNFYFAFQDAGTLSGEPAVATLDAFAGKVEGIVMAIEAETARILRPSAP
jgi:hypothetical protein